MTAANRLSGSLGLVPTFGNRSFFRSTDIPVAVDGEDDHTISFHPFRNSITARNPDRDILAACSRYGWHRTTVINGPDDKPIPGISIRTRLIRAELVTVGEVTKPLTLAAHGSSRSLELPGMTFTHRDFQSRFHFTAIPDLLGPAMILAFILWSYPNYQQSS